MSEGKPGQSAESTQRRRIGIAPVVIGLLLVGIAVVACVAVLRMDRWGERGSGLSERFALDTTELAAVDPSLVTYSETAHVSLPMQTVQAVATGLDGQILVAGDRVVQVFQSDGTPVRTISLAGEPKCLAVGGGDHRFPGRLYVGLDSRVEVYDADGNASGSWTQGLDERSLLTSLAVFEDNVFAADAGNRVVVRWDAEGRLVKTIGREDPQRGIPGFIIPSAHFDVAVPADGVLRVANPGARRIEAYTPDGDLLGQWGEASSRIDGFFGCCNPTNFAMLADGRFVTAEKGIPRVKIYTAEGEFEAVVAAPQMLSPGLRVGQEIRDDHSLGIFDVAADAAGRVLVLDPNTRQVRIFEPKDQQGAAGDAGEST